MKTIPPFIIGTSSRDYLNNPVEFYMEGAKAEIQGLGVTEMGVLRYKESGHRNLDLAFP